MVGVDILHLQEFEKRLKSGGETFLRRAFAEGELRDKSTAHLAGIFCAKEAVMKAAGIEAGGWLRIEIKYEPSGKPFAEVDGRRLPVSIAHHGDYAVAVAADL